MKKMKRLVAILLASVMALVMLTACGEEAPQSLGQRAEKVLMDSLNKAYNTSYENDADLKNKVTAVLNKIDENGEIAATDIPLAYLEGSYNFPGYLEEKDNTYIATYLMVASAQIHAQQAGPQNPLQGWCVRSEIPDYTPSVGPSQCRRTGTPC